MEILNPDAEAIRRRAEQAENTPVYIGLFGQPGAGKSSLVNAISGQQLARVGVENDVTVERTDYAWNGLFLSDLPGYGTEKFPADVYFEKFEITKFDIFLCVVAGKLKNDDVSFFRQLIHDGKRCIFVRNKIDSEFEPGVGQAEIRERIASSLRQQVAADAKVVFTSCITRQGLNELVTTITNTLSGVKRDRFLRSAAIYSKEFLDKKRLACREYVWYAAGLTAAANMLPIPGVGITVDLSTILTTMHQIRADFNLTQARMDRFVHLMPGAAPIVNMVIGYACKEGAMLLLKQLGAGVAVAEAAKYLPGAGTAVAAAVSFAATRLVLARYIDDCYEIAHEMLNAHFQG